MINNLNVTQSPLFLLSFCFHKISAKFGIVAKHFSIIDYDKPVDLYITYKSTDE